MSCIQLNWIDVANAQVIFYQISNKICQNVMKIKCYQITEAKREQKKNSKNVNL